MEKLDFQKLNQLYREVSNHLDLLNLKESLEHGTDTTNLLNVALEDVMFMFTKIGEEELVLADKLKNTLRGPAKHLPATLTRKTPNSSSSKKNWNGCSKRKTSAKSPRMK